MLTSSDAARELVRDLGRMSHSKSPAARVFYCFDRTTNHVVCLRVESLGGHAQIIYFYDDSDAETPPSAALIIMQDSGTGEWSARAVGTGHPGGSLEASRVYLQNILLKPVE
jgi:hypothetical protein